MNTVRQRLTVAGGAGALALGGVGAGVLQATAASATSSTGAHQPKGNAGTININGAESCTRDAASSPDCTTVNGSPHFTG